VPGWFSPEEGAWYAALAADLPRGALVVEVGCWKGRSTAYLAEASRRLRLVCVDDWQGSRDARAADYRAALAREDVRASFDHTLRRFAIEARVLALPSVEAAATFAPRSVDLVFLDASHDLESVRADLAAWHPRVRGALAGHDLDHDDVAQAVAEHAARHHLQVERGPGSAYRLRRPDARPRASNGVEARSCAAPRPRS
jgi:hypothetical protein